MPTSLQLSAWCLAPGRHSVNIGGWSGGFNSSNISRPLGCTRFSRGHHSGRDPESMISTLAEVSDGDVREPVSDLGW